MPAPDLSAFGLAPVPGGPTTQPVPGSSAAAAAAAVTAPAVPGFNRLRIDQVQIGDIVLPPTPEDGRAVLTFAKKRKADEKSGAGKKAPKDTTLAIDPAEGTLVLTWKKRAHGEMKARLAKLPVGSGPFTISHENADVYGVSSVLVDAWEEGIKWNEFQVATVTLKLKEIPLGEGAGVLLLRKGKTDATVKIETGGLGPREVSRWQEFLVAQQFGAILGVPSVDGKFGDTTVAATKAFQTRESCVLIDGIVGPETFGKAAKFGYKAPPAVKILGAGGTKTAGPATDKASIGAGFGFTEGAGSSAARKRSAAGIPGASHIAGEGDP